MSRSISMAFFMTDALLDVVRSKPKGSKTLLGQVLGQVFKIDERTITAKDGEKKQTISLLGDFEAAAVPDADGVIRTDRSGTCYVPAYYARELRAALDASNGSVLIFAIEVLATTTGERTIPYNYDVVSLLERSHDSPMEGLKRKLAATGKLSAALPPPVASDEQQALPAPAKTEWTADQQSLEADAGEPSEPVGEGVAHGKGRSGRKAA